MPYGYRTSRANYVRKRAFVQAFGKTVANYPVDTSRNAPVKRVYKKAKRAPRTIGGQNKTAIMTLGRQVKMLQNQRFGELQTHTQYLSLTNWQNTIPQATKPVAFCLNDFYDQTTKYGTITAGVAAYQNGPAFTRHAYSSDLNDEHEWNARRNTDTVSTLEYKPVYTRCTIGFDFIMQGLRFNSACRVTVLKLKAYNNTSKLAINVPLNLGAYRHLAERIQSEERNYFDKRYHEVLYDKWVNVLPKNRTATETDNIRRNVTISWKYRDMVIKPDKTDFPLAQEFFTNVPIKDQIWVIISCPVELDDKLATVEISKFDVWRDAHGVS